MIRLIGFLGLWFIFLPLNGQKSLRIDTTQDLDRLIERLFDNQTIIVRNVKYLGSKSAIGFFEMDTNAIGVRQGIVLSTGRVQDIPKGNQTPGTSGIAWNNEIRFRSDRDLNKLANGKVSDQVVLEFDFISFENHLTFNYVFASEEYPEYVGSRFNDVFGFILTSDGNFYQNLALVPNKNIPVTINNINHLKN
ncbi:MAG: choice-of-anchor L domain-containing protein, partial [Chitinophagales bacterium]|nr:choice-of-anchor L domain-containing protein [Chitinophagales bacterium]